MQIEDRDNSPVNYLRPALEVVLVDDEAAVVEPLADYLGRFFNVRAFTHPADALVHLNSHDVDLLVTDYCMPGLDGISLISAARRMQPWLRTMVVSGTILSADQRREARDAARVDAVLTKPLAAQELCRHCREILDR